MRNAETHIIFENKLSSNFFAKDLLKKGGLLVGENRLSEPTAIHQ